MSGYTTLRTFSAEELLLAEEEASLVLKFFFSGDSVFIDTLTINAEVRGFAQGLLVEAIDATYAMGFIEAIFRSTANPTQSPMRVIKSFAKKAARHWFRHATANDLMNVKIYESVRVTIALNFRSSLRTSFARAKPLQPHGALLTYQQQPGDKVWG